MEAGVVILGLVSLVAALILPGIFYLGCLLLRTGRAVFLGHCLSHTSMARNPKDGARVCFHPCPRRCPLSGDHLHHWLPARHARTFLWAHMLCVCVCANTCAPLC